MNKYEFKSAYDKITLSEDFKREAREKLLAMAGGDRSAAAVSDDKYGDRAVAIKTTERVKSPARTIIGIVSAAAVLAVCVVGGGYLIKKHGSNIIEPPNSIVPERQWTDRDTAYEFCRSDAEKPYTEEFAKELSEGAKAFHERELEYARAGGMSDEIEKNPDDFSVMASVSYVFPSGSDYFAVKSYSFVQALDAGYFEIYFLKDGEAELLGEFDYTYDTLISDGEYLYYLLDEELCRISPEGVTENILSLTEYDPENPDVKMEMGSLMLSVSGSGDYLTLEMPYGVRSTGFDISYRYTHVINVVTLNELQYEYVNMGMPRPFDEIDPAGYDFFYQPFVQYFEDIPSSLMFHDSMDPINKYFDRFDIVNNPSDSIMGYPNLYSYVRYFELTSEQILEGLAFLIEDEGNGITDYEIKNFIIEDNATEASAFFANEYALVIGNKIYSPNWLYIHTVDEWREAGVICQQLEDIAIACRDFPFTDEARAAFEAKFEEALGHHVSLEYQLPEETAEPAVDVIPEKTYDDLATIDVNGNFIWSGHTGSADITLQALEAVPAPERDESQFKTFDDPIAAATEAINRSKYHGLVLVGQVANGENAEYVYPLEDTYGVDMGQIARFDPRVVPDYTLDAPTSIYNDDLVSLHYTDGSGGELYINITAREADGRPERYVTDGSGNIYTGFATDKLPTYVLSEKDDNAHNFINSYGAFSFMYIGGKQVDGVNYFYAYRKSGDMPEDFELNISAKGCTLDDFMDIIAAVVQYRAWGFGDFNGYRLTDGDLPEFNPTSVETEHGTLVLNQGKYLGTGAGFNYDVNSAIPMDGVDNPYTEEDMSEFTGNSALFDLPLGFEPTETEVNYSANYAEFRDGYNIQLFHEGRPLIGEYESDEDFIEAHEYYGFCYSNDKLSYFKNKTPIVQVYNADFSDENSSVSIQALKGDFGERYMGFGFQFLPAEPSDLCADYYNDYIYAQGNGESSLSRIFAAEYSNQWDETLHNHYYGGFLKNGVYYVVTVENVSEQAFADILAALYQG